MDGILNERTNTVHKREADGPEYRTECGLTQHVERERLQGVRLERATSSADTDKCGRCFPGAGGY